MNSFNFLKFIQKGKIQNKIGKKKRNNFNKIKININNYK